jgi:hypothetical protein
VLGVAIVAVFVLLLVLLLPRLSLAEGLLVAAAVCSPAVMLAVERANVDVVVVSGLALAALVWRRGGAAQYVAVALVLLMALAKLYPVVALAAFLPTRRRVAGAAAAALLVFAGYVVAIRDDIATISAVATQGQYHSYGARILLGRLYHAVAGDTWRGSRTVAQALVLLAVMALALGVWVMLRRRGRGRSRRPRLPEEWNESSALLAFRMGALVYLGTFVAGNSFDYRLVCLLLVLPGLLRWPVPEGARPAAMSLPRVTLGVVLLMLWVSALSEPLRLWDELVSWTLAGVLVVLLVRSLPPLSSVLHPLEAATPDAARR